MNLVKWLSFSKMTYIKDQLNCDSPVTNVCSLNCSLWAYNYFGDSSITFEVIGQFSSMWICPMSHYLLAHFADSSVTSRFTIIFSLCDFIWSHIAFLATPRVVKFFNFLTIAAKRIKLARRLNYGLMMRYTYSKNHHPSSLQYLLPFLKRSRGS